ncbi:MAG: peroxiredoxin family protein [Verrucomicrobiota bacterium]
MGKVFRSKTGIGAIPLVVILVMALATVLFLYRNWQTRIHDSPSGAAVAAPEAGAPATRTVPPFALKDINGNLYSSSRFAGKPTVINFFATWCPPCQEEIPGFVQVYNRHKAQGFELIGISIASDSREDLAGFLMSHRIDYRILLGDLATAKAFGGISSIPATFFVGKDGRIQKVHVGFLSEEDFDREVRKLL